MFEIIEPPIDLIGQHYGRQRCQQFFWFPGKPNNAPKTERKPWMELLDKDEIQEKIKQRPGKRTGMALKFYNARQQGLRAC